MKITFISDTHNKHKQISPPLLGGDILICSGDISSVGRPHEIDNFLKWFSKLDYEYKIFAAGNHDWGFQNNTEEINSILSKYKPSVIYLQDEMIEIKKVKIYASPWQPEFCNWAFNLIRNGAGLKYIWDKIPIDTDILITHTPPYGHLDQCIGEDVHYGCELLAERIKIVKPKINVFGHIHSGHGYKYDGATHFINASVLNEEYVCEYPPMNVRWNKKTNNIKFL